MNRLARIAASLVIAAAAAWAVYEHCYQRYACNLQEARARESLTPLFSIPDEITSRIAARRAIEEMTHCLECSPASISAYMIRGAALRMLRRQGEAAQDYRRALRLDRRAELYFNLGQAELDAGRQESAADAFGTAVLLLYPYVDDIPQPMQTRVRAEITPIVTTILRRQATPELARQLRTRLTRDPM